MRLGEQIAMARGSFAKDLLTSEFLAYLGCTHNTPKVRHEWECQ